MTDDTRPDGGPAEIFLQPECCATPDTGRLWCEHDAPVDCEEGQPWTRYIRADWWRAKKDERNDLRERLRDKAIFAEAKCQDDLADLLREAAEALASPEQGEPVAWALEFWTGDEGTGWRLDHVTDSPLVADAWGSPSARDAIDPGFIDRSDCFRAVPLYTHPSPEPTREREALEILLRDDDTEADWLESDEYGPEYGDKPDEAYRGGLEDARKAASRMARKALEQNFIVPRSGRAMSDEQDVGLDDFVVTTTGTPEYVAEATGETSVETGRQEMIDEINRLDAKAETQKATVSATEVMGKTSGLTPLSPEDERLIDENMSALIRDGEPTEDPEVVAWRSRWAAASSPDEWSTWGYSESMPERPSWLNPTALFERFPLRNAHPARASEPRPISVAKCPPAISPIARGDVQIRYRKSEDPDRRGWIVEANAGLIVEGAGHYGEDRARALQDAERFAAMLAAHPAQDEGEALDDLCSICGHTLGTQPFMGDGDGTGQKFAHEPCYRLRELLAEQRGGFSALAAQDEAPGLDARLREWLMEPLPAYNERPRLQCILAEGIRKVQGPTDADWWDDEEHIIKWVMESLLTGADAPEGGEDGR